MPVTVILSKRVARAVQPLRARLNVAVFLHDLRAQLFQPLDVQVDRTRSNRASARNRNPRPSHPRHQRPQHQRRSPHRLHQLVAGLGIRVQIGRADRRPVLRPAVAQLHLRAHRRQQSPLGFNVPHLRNVFQNHRLHR